MKEKNIQPVKYVFTGNDEREKKVFSQFFQEISTDAALYYEPYIEYNNLKVHMTFFIDVIDQCKLEIKFIDVKSSEFPQGIDTCVHNATMKLCDGSHDETKRGFAFMFNSWKNSSILLTCDPVRFRNQKKQHLYIENPNKTQYGKWFSLHNIWEAKKVNRYIGHNADGTLRFETFMERESWGGNYGVVIEDRGKDEFRLHFSCGATQHPNVTFEDMVVDIKIEGNYRSRFQCSDITDLELLQNANKSR
jgi:hypothetical protein